MKKIFLFLLFTIYYLLFTISIEAATPTPTKPAVEKPTSSEIISDLKERIASRVAQLKLVEKKGIIGTVTDISDTQITLSDLQNNTKFIDVDEITKFSSPSAKGSFGISDITKGTKLGILGLYNKQSRRILARFVDVITTVPKIFHGVVSAKDPEEFTLNLALENGEELIVDVENITKTQSFSKSAGLTRSGFSKIKEGERLMVVGFPNLKNKNLPAGKAGRIVALRIILFPEIPKNPKIVIPQKALSPQETITPSTGSGKKLTPITK